MPSQNTSLLRPPPAVHQRLAAGIAQLRAGRLDEARELVDLLLRDHADVPDVLLLACDLRLAQDEAEVALTLIERAVELAPASVRLRSRQAFVLMALMRRSEAKQVAAWIAVRAGDDALALWEAGRIHARCDDPVMAERYLLQARALGCEEPALLYDLASARFFLGKVEDAQATLGALLGQPSRVGVGQALYLRSTLRVQQPGHNHIEDLRARLRTGFAQPADTAACLYALAKELEDLGEWNASFAALDGGARHRRACLSYDAAAERATIDRIGQVYTAEAIAQGTPGYDAVGPVFVLGLPRTGTTLVERILARHPDAASVGELPYFSGAVATALGRRLRTLPPGTDPVEASLGIDFAALGQTYLAGARQAADHPSALLIDKMPANFMYCGLIRKALPRARIIHVVRDPMDACYAIYKTLFQQAYHWSYDLADLADYYITYRRLMRHWQEAMPGQILDVHYEQLVAEPEAQARRLLEWCALAWDSRVLDAEADARPASTASASQVREPVHDRSVGKWRRYESQLAPLRERLSAAGIPLA